MKKIAAESSKKRGQKRQKKLAAKPPKAEGFSLLFLTFREKEVFLFEGGALCNYKYLSTFASEKFPTK